MVSPVGEDLATALSAGATPPGVARFLLGGRFGMEPYEVSQANLDHFVGRGGQLVETAHSYARGQSKEVLGRWLRAHPGELGVVTKVGHDFTGGDIPLDRATVVQHVEDSLSALGLDQVEVLMYHCDDVSRSPEDLADTLVGLIEAGHTRWVGASNWASARLDALAALVAERGHRLVASYHCSLADPDPVLLQDTRYADPAVLEVVGKRSLPLFSWSSQAQGFFARSGPRPSERGPDAFDTEVNQARRARCVDLAEELDSRSETVALAWSLGQGFLWPSIGPSTAEQLDRSLSALNLQLSADQMRWLRDGGDRV